MSQLKVSFTTKEVLSKCQQCKDEKLCFMYPCGVNYRRKEGEFIDCKTKIPICTGCYNPDNVYVCHEHTYKLNTMCRCDYTSQSWCHSPVYYDFPFLGIRRVYDATCYLCDKNFYTCGSHPDSPYKKITCAQCCRDKLGQDCPHYLHGLKAKQINAYTSNEKMTFKTLVQQKLDALAQEKYEKIKAKIQKKIDKLQQSFEKLTKEDDEGFVKHVTQRQKRKFKSDKSDFLRLLYKQTHTNKHT
jgi:hypothetical protein